ncbi:MAG: hypothetical protein IPP72_03280 [Chitinophagaceae bacterium]|nr:hypothetical protein [Chitinophagaceae bacterium]
MTDQQQSLKELQQIKQMMERSSRFISLSGLSGIAAGVCALIGAYIAHDYVVGRKDYIINADVAVTQALANDYGIILNTWIFWIAAATFVAAVTSAFIFTWIKSKRQGIPLWGKTAKRLIINVSIPLIAGGIFLFKLIHFGTFGLIAPGCLIFYGLALVNASKYTLDEVRYLGYCQVILGLINLGFVGAGIYFWAVGFGVLHIVYGTVMWYKYEREEA